MQSECIARRFDGKDLLARWTATLSAWCIAYLRQRKVFSYGPKRIQRRIPHERIVHAVGRSTRRRA